MRLKTSVIGPFLFLKHSNSSSNCKRSRFFSLARSRAQSRTLPKPLSSCALCRRLRRAFNSRPSSGVPAIPDLLLARSDSSDGAESTTPYAKMRRKPGKEMLKRKHKRNKKLKKLREKNKKKQQQQQPQPQPPQSSHIEAASKPSATYHTSQAGSSLHPNSRRQLQNIPSEPLPMIQHPDETPVPAL